MAPSAGGRPLRTAPAVVSVHVLDPLGEEGLLADAAVCRELQCRPLSVASALLTPEPRAAGRLEPLSRESLGRQLRAALAGPRPAVARVGILCDAGQVETVAGLLEQAAPRHLVLAPMARVAGADVMDEATLEALGDRLFARAEPLVVRAVDLEALCGHPCGDVEDVKRATGILRSRGARAVLVVGIVRRGRVLDVLDEQGRIGIFDASRLTAPRIPGLAAAHAAALSCHLALGHPLAAAVDRAQRYIAVRLQRGA